MKCCSRFGGGPTRNKKGREGVLVWPDILSDLLRLQRDIFRVTRGYLGMGKHATLTHPIPFQANLAFHSQSHFKARVHEEGNFSTFFLLLAEQWFFKTVPIFLARKKSGYSRTNREHSWIRGCVSVTNGTASKLDHISLKVLGFGCGCKGFIASGGPKKAFPCAEILGYLRKDLGPGGIRGLCLCRQSKSILTLITSHTVRHGNRRSTKRCTREWLWATIVGYGSGW